MASQLPPPYHATVQGMYYPTPPNAYYPPPPPQQTIIINKQQTVTQHPQTSRPTLVVVKRQGVNHSLHFWISVLFFPWIFVWITLCILEEL